MNKDAESLLARLVEKASSMHSCDWDVGTEQNAGLVRRLLALLPALEGTERAGTRPQIVALFVEDAMNLDLDEGGSERLTAVVEHYLLRIAKE